jgi:hypothetical protein
MSDVERFYLALIDGTVKFDQKEWKKKQTYKHCCLRNQLNNFECEKIHLKNSLIKNIKT